MAAGKKTPLAFFQQDDVVQLAKALLGKILMTNIEGRPTGGIIVETEAYAGAADKASHAYNNRRTQRTEPMFAAGGITYIYLCYGVHHLLNIVTGKKDVPHAILIRALEPTRGVATMLLRRKQTKPSPALTAGPGSLAQALGLTLKHNSLQLDSNAIWLEEAPLCGSILASPRVGVGYAGEDAKNPWRFRIKDNKWTSPAK